MLKVSNVDDIDVLSLDIDTFWNTGLAHEHKSHRIHAYPAKFPAFITQKAIDFAKSEGVEVNTIADVFCGCGTVAFEAKRLGINFWGCDINPTAVLIAKAKSNTYKSDKINAYFAKILSKFDEEIKTVKPTAIKNERIHYWFSENQIQGLEVLKLCILDAVPSNSKYRDYFLCAFSNILKPTSKWLTKSIKPQIDPQKNPIPVREAFFKQCSMMSKTLDNKVNLARASTTIKCENALEIKKKDFIDLIITSPPYVTSYEYADLHQLTTLWLDYAADYRTLRKNSIGSTHGSITEENIKTLNKVGREVYEELLKIDSGKASGVAKYYIDMQEITNICWSMLKKNGMIAVVIGNTEYKNVHVNNAKHLLLALQTSGFSDISITKRKISGKILTPYRDEMGKFSTDNTKRQVYSEEFIVTGRK